ncbi:alpha/beta fold hydrolase [Levilactobacillus brevis]|nr:alpha/beta hydrolase [Levilactobacillus brevis]
MTTIIREKKQLIQDLSVAYLEAGPQSGQTIILFHGFPDSPTSYSEIMIELATQGYHVIAPYLRGFAPTTLTAPNETPAGDIETLGADAIRFFDSLHLNKAIIVGQDWGSAVAEILSIFRANAIHKLVKLNWYGIYMMGDTVTQFDAEGFSYRLWRQWTPNWDNHQEELFKRAKSAFQTPEFSKIVLSAYRSGMHPQKTGDHLHQKLATLPPIQTNTIILSGSHAPVDSGVMSQDVSQQYFTGRFEHRVIPNVGHFIHHQNKEAVISAILS